MKTRYNALHSVAMMLGLLLVGGVTGAWADLKKSEMGNDVCSPKIHFKLPDGWTNAYLMISGQGIPFPNPRLADNGWTLIDLGSTKANDDVYFFINGVNKNDCNDGMCITRNGVNVKPNNARIEGFKCSDVGADGELWIQEHPDITKEGQVYVATAKPVVKDFYIFLPDNKTWKSSTPMIDEDGKPHALQVDNDHCGWYYRRYILDGKIDKALPSSVILYRDDDAERNGAIGMGGEKALNEDQTAEPIVLADVFSLFETDEKYKDAVYFLADELQADAYGGDTYGWSAERPDGAVGNCSYNLAALIYDTDAQLHPLFSCYADGARSGNDGCQESAKSQDAIYSCIGVRQGLVESKLAIENGKKKMKLTTAGKSCFLDQGTFDQMFNMTKDVNEMSCYDMTFTRAKDGKWEFDSDYFTSDGVSVQGGFYPVETTDDDDILAADASQTPAPKARPKRFAEGPVFYGPELRVNDPTEQIPKIDVYCAGPGWPKKAGVAYDCEGLFADGDGTTERINSDLKLGTMNQAGCVFGWSCDERGNAPENWPFYTSGTETKVTTQGTGRWQSKETTNGKGGRNQHFCFESHANFRFKKGLKFNFRGDDDIWVFIDNKLAVDLGGTHLAAPGYVDLDYFMKNVGGYSNLDEIVGKSYDIDIFFCDRRTTMSNVRIKTNMFIEQTTGIMAEGKQDTDDYIKTGNNHFKICYKKSGNGSCAAVAAGGSGEELKCGKDITEKITYVFTQDKTAQDPTKTKLGEDDFAANAKQACNKDGSLCGIDVSDPSHPIINDDVLKESFPSGVYYLVIKIGNDTKAIEVKIKGTIGVADREAVPVDENNVKGFLHEFKAQAMASSAPLDTSKMIPLYVAAILDPCTKDGCTDPLEMQPSANAAYSLQVSNSKVVFYKMKDGKLSQVDLVKDGTTVSQGGIDTIYATIPFDEMESTLESVSINVKGSSRKAQIKFFVPTLAFVDSDSSYNVINPPADPDKMKDSRMKGSSYPFYLVALDGNNAPCKELCNFELTKGSKTSAGLTILSGLEIVNGRATVWLQSSKVYDKSIDGVSATLHITGPNAALTQASYTNLQFIEPPIPIPQFADIYDVYGKPVDVMNINGKDKNGNDYFRSDLEYLDGIADSLVIYYHRTFPNFNDPDSLNKIPNKIVVYWDEDETDSTEFDATEIRRGLTCGSDIGIGAKVNTNLDPEICVNKISLSTHGKVGYTDRGFSKGVKTSGVGKITSWATFSKAKGATPVTQHYEAPVYDRVAPIIVAARAIADNSSSGKAQLKLTFSESVQKTDVGAQQGENVFSFFVNAENKHEFRESIDVAQGITYGNKFAIEHTFLYSQDREFPQAGDYIHFRAINGIGLIKDQSEYSNEGLDAIRNAAAALVGETSTTDWNIAPAYDSYVDPFGRVPSPWALITGDVESYAERLVPSGYTGIPATIDPKTLPSVEVLTFDAFKDKEDFKQGISGVDGNKAALNTGFGRYGNDYVPHGWYVKSDMSALIVADSATQAKIGRNYKDVVFNYQIQLFSNLGNHVLTKEGKIYCDDAENVKPENGGVAYFDNSNCVDKPKNFFIIWNMKDGNDRLVGSGAYISKLKSSVTVGDTGTKNKFEKTEMWGVRHHTKVIRNTPAITQQTGN